jgi:hypothetical protein
MQRLGLKMLEMKRVVLFSYVNLNSHKFKLNKMYYNIYLII